MQAAQFRFPQKANLQPGETLFAIGIWNGGYHGHSPDLVAACMSERLQWLAARPMIRPHAGQVLPCEALPGGLALLFDRRATGKAVIRVGQAP